MREAVHPKESMSNEMVGNGARVRIARKAGCVYGMGKYISNLPLFRAKWSD